MRNRKARGIRRDSLAWLGTLPLADSLHLSLLHPLRRDHVATVRFRICWPLA